MRTGRDIVCVKKFDGTWISTKEKLKAERAHYFQQILQNSSVLHVDVHNAYVIFLNCVHPIIYTMNQLYNMVSFKEEELTHALHD